MVPIPNNIIQVIHTYLQEQNQGPIYYLMLNVPKRPELPPRSYIISKTLPPPANDWKLPQEMKD